MPTHSALQLRDCACMLRHVHQHNLTKRCTICVCMLVYVMTCYAICNRDNEVTVAPNTAEAQSHIAPLLSSGLYHHKIDSTGLITYAVTGAY
jgi:hypothetical protein